MKNHIYFIALCLIIFVIGYSINSIAISDTGCRVAVVDVSTLISKSSQFAVLKTEQQKKSQEIQNLLNKARQDIAKETDSVKIAQIEEKYRNQINDKKIALDNEYNTKLKQIDNDIKSIITSKAKDMRYNLVLPKNIVLFGGDDITNEVAKSVK